MRLPYRLTEMVGTGSFASVFSVEYQGKEVALKLQKGQTNNKGVKNDRIKVCHQEYNNLESLKGIQGIPQAILPLYDLEETYSSLDLKKLGCSVEKVMGYLPISGEIYFDSGFLLELVKDGIDIYKEGVGMTYPESFFDDLERIVREVNQRELFLPTDICILEKENKPYLVDWYNANNLSTSPLNVKRTMLDGDLKRVEKMRKYRSNKK